MDSDEVVELGAAAAIGGAAVVAAAPVTVPAGLLGIAMTRFAQRRQRRQAELLGSLATALERVEGRVDHDFVESEDFDDLVITVIEKGNQAQEIDKRDYYANILAHSAVERPDPDDVGRMIDTLQRLRKPHLWLLGELLRKYEWDDGPVGPSPLPSSFEQEFGAKHPGLDFDRIRQDWRELEAAGLVDGFPSGMQSQGGARNFRGAVTDMGRRFHEFVVLPYDDVHPRT